VIVGSEVASMGGITGKMGSDCREWSSLDGYLLVTRMGHRD
jgi:hypothetical protein